MNGEEFKRLIDKYLEGKASQAEEARLLQYYESMQENKEWQDNLMGEQEVVKSRLFSKISQKIDQAERPGVAPFYRTWKIAACVALLIGLSCWVFLRQHNAPLWPAPAQMFTKAAPADKPAKIRLDDGTLVFLNKGSKIIYPEQFTGSSREITLSGEAYFEVAGHKEPFIIHSGKMTTRVLGTSFNVKAYETDERIRISVLTGKVSVSISENKSAPVLLTPNQEVVYDKQKNSVKKSVAVDASLAIAWRQGKIKFRNTPFSEALAELNRIYGVKINCQDKLKDCLLFADFNNNDELDKVLQILSKSLNGKVYHESNGAYLLTGTVCK